MINCSDYKLQSSEVAPNTSLDTAGGVFLPNPIPTAYPPSAVVSYQEEPIDCDNDGIVDDEEYDEDFW